MRVPDSLDMFNSHQARQQQKLNSLPICAECGEPIQDEDCFVVGGEIYCSDCILDSRRSTENFIN